MIHFVVCLEGDAFISDNFWIVFYVGGIFGVRSNFRFVFAIRAVQVCVVCVCSWFSALCG